MLSKRPNYFYLYQMSHFVSVCHNSVLLNFDLFKKSTILYQLFSSFSSLRLFVFVVFLLTVYFCLFVDNLFCIVVLLLLSFLFVTLFVVVVKKKYLSSFYFCRFLHLLFLFIIFTFSLSVCES